MTPRVWRARPFSRQSFIFNCQTAARAGLQRHASSPVFFVEAPGRPVSRLVFSPLGKARGMARQATLISSVETAFVRSSPEALQSQRLPRSSSPASLRSDTLTAAEIVGSPLGGPGGERHETILRPRDVQHETRREDAQAARRRRVVPARRAIRCARLALLLPPPITGKQNTISFGPFPEVGLADARAKCDAAHVLLAKSIDPSEHKQEVRRAAAITADAVLFSKVAATGSRR